MCSLAVSTVDSPAVEPRSNLGSGKILMSENLRLYTTSPVVIYVLIDKVLSSEVNTNGYWFEGDWLHSKRDASPVIERLMVRGSEVALKHVIYDMVTRTLVMKLRRRAIKRWVPCGDMDRSQSLSQGWVRISDNSRGMPIR